MTLLGVSKAEINGAALAAPGPLGAAAVPRGPAAPAQRRTSAGLMSQNSEESLPPTDIGSSYLRITLPISSDPHGVEKQIKLATRLLSRKQERFASQQEHPNTQENCFTAPC